MNCFIKSAAVIGAGAMGSAIAAHIANAGLPVLLLDIVPGELQEKEKVLGLTLKDPFVRNRIVRDCWENCKKSRPPALFSLQNEKLITLGNLEDDFDKLAGADWIVEAIVEDLKIKQSLFARIEKIAKPACIVTTNTSGLSIQDIVQGRSQKFKHHFMGTHFFNPPRYMKLLELIPGKDTSASTLNCMREFCERVLGKTVVLCKDTPNFIANRYISFSGGYTVNYALEHGFSVSEVDALTGKIIGRPKTATFRLYDLIGLDIIHHVNTNLYEVIPDDPYREVLKNPKSKTLFHNMMEKRLYGNKTKAGFYKQVYTEKGKAFLQLNLQNGEYENIIEPEERLLQSYNNIKELKGRLRAICNDAWEERDKTEKSYAGFIWNTLAFTLNYSAWVMPRVSENLLSFDRAIKFGFGHELGPFEIWDALGLKEGCKRIQQIGFSIPDWVDKMIAQGYESFYKIQEDQLAFYDPVQGKYQNLKLNKRSLGFEYIKNNKKWILDSNDSASIVNLGDGVLGLEFHSKANSLNLEISAMLEKALSLLERSTWQGMVIANDGNNFSAGADLGMFLEHIENRAWDKMENLVSSLQQNLLLCRGNRKPVVAAPFNMTLGGGSEIALESSAICAYAETYMGQIEPSVGVVPALGGCKEPLRRILSPVMRRTPNENPLPLLLQVFQLIVMNKVSSSAQEARDWGFIVPTDRIVINRDHLLSSAKRMVLDLAEASYTPDSARGDIYATGITGYNYLEVYIYNMHEAGFITKHEALIARKLANILSGGPLSQPQWVDSQYILDLEREAFISLLGEEKTRERINSVLTTGKHLRN